MMLLLWRTNSYIEITTTVHIIRHSIMADTIMAIVHIMAVMVTIMGLIITDIIEMSTIMPSAITSIVMRFAIVEKIHIIIYQINTEMPFVLMRINGTVEMLSPHKTTILRTGKYPTKIIITHIQKIIVRAVI